MRNRRREIAFGALCAMGMVFAVVASAPGSPVATGAESPVAPTGHQGPRANWKKGALV